LDGLTPLGRYPAGTALMDRLIENARYGNSAAGPDTLILLARMTMLVDSGEARDPLPKTYTLGWKMRYQAVYASVGYSSRFGSSLIVI
jgi:hypothetical protein